MANSVDLSEGYWTRDKSLPISLILNSGQKTDTLGLNGSPYQYTPYQVIFEGSENQYTFKYEYNVCEDLPVFVLRIKLINNTNLTDKLTLTAKMKTTLRTSHTYSSVSPDEIRYTNENSIASLLNFVHPIIGIIYGLSLLLPPS